MTHSVLIQNGVAHQIWRDTPKRQLKTLFHPDIIKQIVQVTADVEQGDVWDGKVFSRPAPQQLTASGAIRRRDKLLAASDWTQLADATVDREMWAAYRQALRDIPQQAGFPADVEWPVEPA